MALTAQNRKDLNKNMKEYVASYKEVASLSDEISRLTAQVEQLKGKLLVADTRLKEAEHDVQGLVQTIPFENKDEVAKIVGKYLGQIAVMFTGFIEEEEENADG